MNNLYLQSTYVAKYDFLINRDIREYDISKANISILYSLGLISKSKYEYYKSLPKQQREISLGLLQRDNKKIRDGLKNGFIQYRKQFIESNDIHEDDILYIDKDSITTIDHPCDITKMNNIVEFKYKKQYTSFYNINGIHLLYYNKHNEESFRLKYANQEALMKTHMGYFLDIILTIAYSGEHDSIIDTINLIRSMYSMYVNKQFDIGFYREFNYNNKFKFIQPSYNSPYIYYSDIIDSRNLQYLDISWNLSLIQRFYKIFMTLYFKT